MEFTNQANILYYSIPNGTLVPLLDANGQYVPASAFPGAIPVNIIATLEPTIPHAVTTTAAAAAGQPASTAIAQQAATTAAQTAPQEQQQPPACVIMFLQRDGSYGLRPDSVSISLPLGNL